MIDILIDPENSNQLLFLEQGCLREVDNVLCPTEDLDYLKVQASLHISSMVILGCCGDVCSGDTQVTAYDRLAEPAKSLCGEHTQAQIIRVSPDEINSVLGVTVPQCKYYDNGTNNFDLCQFLKDIRNWNASSHNDFVVTV